MSYTRQISEDEEMAALVAGVVHLACSLGLEVVAEGVETQRQFDLLRSMGCHFAQGYLLGMPLEAERLREYVSREEERRSAA
jgi:EAL domain-containing protein (putative c-di-GMP-specific phosphodiesterase class I)